MSTLPKDTLVLTADLTTAELAEALGGLRFQHGSRCLVSLDKFSALSRRGDATPLPAAVDCRYQSFI